MDSLELPLYLGAPIMTAFILIYFYLDNVISTRFNTVLYSK